MLVLHFQKFLEIFGNRLPREEKNPRLETPSGFDIFSRFSANSCTKESALIRSQNDFSFVFVPAELLNEIGLYDCSLFSEISESIR